MFLVLITIYFKTVLLLLLYLQTDKVDPNVQEYDGFDHIKALDEYAEVMNLGKIDINVFQCKTKSKIPAFYANVKVI